MASETYKALEILLGQVKLVIVRELIFDGAAADL